MDLLNDLVDAFLFSDVKMKSAFNKETKEVLLDADQSKTGEPGIDWDDEKAREKFVPIPQITSSEAHSLMSEFANEQEQELQTLLLDVLNRKKPFSQFKEKVKSLDIEEAWYDYENDYAKREMGKWLNTVL